ncbi:MAG TPA: pirin family protein [Roseiarcus sp.]|nr:pirin family protein [Roseiarcus sp.]
MPLPIVNVEIAGPRVARGPGHSARLVIAPEQAAEHSPFILMAEDWFGPPAGFPTHPHRGIETVTFVLAGELLHEDHTGGKGRLFPGDAQFMTAGGGVMHSEMPGPYGVQTLQLWLNLPARLKMTPARYADLRLAGAPVVRKDGAEARVYSGRLGDVDVPHGSAWPLALIDLRLEARSSFAVPIPDGNRAFAYVLEGAALIGANKRAAEAGDVAWAALSVADDDLPIAAHEGARLLVFASPVIDEPIVMGGPFVMNTREEILEAFADLRAARLTEPKPARV